MGGRLSGMNPFWQKEVFNNEIAKLKQRRDGFISEKQVTKSQVKSFGIVTMFKNLGWEAASKCYDGETKEIYMDTI